MRTVFQIQKVKNPLTNQGVIGLLSLADWDMSSGRNPFAKWLAVIVAYATLPANHFANGRAKARLLIKKIPNVLNRTPIHGRMASRFH